MESKKYPKKKFRIGRMQNIILENYGENIDFLSTRIDNLKLYQYGTSEFYAILEEIFKEFVDIYEFDKETAVLPEPLGIFKSEEHRKDWIENNLLAIEFDYHLGCILYNYHEWLVDNENIPDVILGRMVTDYPSVYERVLYDYVSVLKNMPPQYPFSIAFRPNSGEGTDERGKIIESLQREQLYGNVKPYFASFALPSLIEHFLLGFMQQDLVNNLMVELYAKHRSGVVNLTEDNQKFVNIFLNKANYMDGSKEYAMRKCRDLFVGAGLMSDKSAEQIVLGVQGKSPVTLGQFLKNPYAISHIRKPYYDVLDILFSTKKVNLRNSIMHGSSITFDPYAMAFSAVMLQIFWVVMKRRIFQ